jgi:hypothetical protein
MTGDSAADHMAIALEVARRSENPTVQARGALTDPEAMRSNQRRSIYFQASLTAAATSDRRLANRTHLPPSSHYALTHSEVTRP